MKEPLVIIRPFEEGDRRFIEASWFESYLKALRLPELPFEVFKHGMNARIARLLARSEVLVAAARIAPDEILGYIVADKESKALHWLYVKASFRRNGIGSTLADAAKVVSFYTHKPSREGHRFLTALGYNFNPRLADPDADLDNSAG